MDTQTQNPFVPIAQFNEITANIIKRTGECSLTNINDILDIGAKHLKNLSNNSKNIEEIFNLVNELGATYINCSQRTFNVGLENFAEVTKWIESNSQNLNPLGQAKSFGEQMVQNARAFGEQAMNQGLKFTETMSQQTHASSQKASKSAHR